MTPFELSQIDNFQDRNRGYADDEDVIMDAYFNWED